MLRRSWIALAAVAMVALALAASGHAAPAREPAARRCGLTPRIDGQRLDVQEVQGAVPCHTVMRVVTRYLRTFKFTRPWYCVLGHGSSPYAASCSRGKRVLVRVYAPT